MSQSPFVHGDGPRVKRQKKSPVSVAGQESNTESIDIVREELMVAGGRKLRDTILSRIPLETLGYIFEWVVTPERDDPPTHSQTFKGINWKTYDFLTVCREWYTVARHTPEVWKFWGNTLRDWEKMSNFNKGVQRGILVDLVLDERSKGPKVLNIPLQEELKRRATEDKIGCIHLNGNGSGFLKRILSSLTPDGDGVQEKRIQSIIIICSKVIPEEFWNLCARLRLPRLQHLEISGILLATPISWGHLTSQFTRLTYLSLQLLSPSPPLVTAFQLISVLVSNPQLQHLSLFRVIPDEVRESGIQVPLRHLRTIELTGEFHSVFGLLHRLEYPAPLEIMDFNVENATSKDIRQTLEPYMRDLFGHAVWLRDGLQVFTAVGSYSVIVDVLSPAHYPREALNPKVRFSSARLTISTSAPLPGHALLFDLMAFIPQNHVEIFHLDHTLDIPEGIFIGMPKLETLWLHGATLSDGPFLQPDQNGPHAGKKLFPSLQTLRLFNVTAEGDNWQSLITYLAHQTSDGQSIFLEVKSENDIPPEVIEVIRGLVKVLEYTPGGRGTFGYGSELGEEEQTLSEFPVIEY